MMSQQRQSERTEETLIQPASPTIHIPSDRSSRTASPLYDTSHSPTNLSPSANETGHDDVFQPCFKPGSVASNKGYSVAARSFSSSSSSPGQPHGSVPNGSPSHLPTARLESVSPVGSVPPDRPRDRPPLPRLLTSTSSITFEPLPPSSRVRMRVQSNHTASQAEKSPSDTAARQSCSPKLSSSVSSSPTALMPRDRRTSRFRDVSDQLDFSDSQIGNESQWVVASPGVIGDATPCSGRLVVVAIDFGTTFSGYAFSFVRDSTDSIFVMRKWEGGDPGVVNQKTPTVLLLTPSGEFHSFGFTARDFYHDLSEADARKWLYFDKFKMALHYSMDLNRDSTVTASNGKPFSALKVFSHALRFFKDHVLQELCDQSATDVVAEDVRWVITVPAIWKAPAKQFMRQAAYEADIASEDCPSQLLIALEPEVASVYVRRLRLYQLLPDTPTSVRPLSVYKNDNTSHQHLDFTKSDDGSTFMYNTFPSKAAKRLSSASPNSTLHRQPTSSLVTVGHQMNVEGMVYMIVDCGGGTVDITVHQLESAVDGGLKELYKATGGPYGSAGVDSDFEKLLVDIFSAEIVRSFKTKRPAGWVDLMMAFESRKRAASPYKTAPLNISLPFSFIDYYKKQTGSSVESAIKKYGNPDVRWSAQGMLRLTPDAMKMLFLGTLAGIRQAIGDVLNAPNVKGVQYMFVVGGFAESPILQTELRKEFGQLLKILIPQEVGLVVLKGAVLFGLDPTVVTVRRSRLTYGLGVLNRYDPDKHPKSKMIHKDGIDWCVDVLDKIVVTDQCVALGDTVVRSYTPAKIGQQSIVIHVYCSERSDATFISDPGVKRCGTLSLDLTDVQYRSTDSLSRRRREIQARMTFSDTEVHVTALDTKTGKCVKASIDFLNK